MKKEIINRLNYLFSEIEKIGKCPNCYFENRKHEIKLMEAVFNVSHTFQCNKCNGIYDTDSVIECIDLDIRKKEK